MTLRNRLGLASLLVSAAMLLVAGWVVVHEHQRASLAALDASLEVRLDDLIALDEQNATPSGLGISEAEDTIAMVVSSDGTAILTTDRFGQPGEALAAIDGYGEPFTASLPSFSETLGTEKMRLLASRTSDGGTAIVAQSVQRVNDSVSDLRRTLLIVGPILAVIAAVLTRMLVGRALAPVAAMQREASDISLNALDRRIYQPTSDDEIAALARSLNAMLGRLEASADAQRRLVADAAHELRSPLTALVTQLEVDLTHPGRADWPTTAAEALAEGHRLQALIDNLLLLARIDSNETVPATTLVDLDELVHDTVRRIERNRSIHIDRSGVGAGLVRGDADQLQRCIQNVLDNAVRYADTSVVITLAEQPEHVRLTIVDDGPGVPLDERDRIFERFYRASAARDRETGGAGIGLAIVYEIVAGHGGAVWAESATPHGTAIIMTFPPISPAQADTGH